MNEVAKFQKYLGGKLVKWSDSGNSKKNILFFHFYGLKPRFNGVNGFSKKAMISKKQRLSSRYSRFLDSDLTFIQSNVQRKSNLSFVKKKSAFKFFRELTISRKG